MQGIRRLKRLRTPDLECFNYQQLILFKKRCGTGWMDGWKGSLRIVYIKMLTKTFAKYNFKKVPLPKPIHLFTPLGSVKQSVMRRSC